MPRKKQKTEPAGMERRQAARHAVERPCRIAPEAPSVGELDGITTNVSRSGMLVRFPDLQLIGGLPRIGEEVRVLLDLPPSANYAPRSLECVARVVRAEGPPGGAPALALEVRRMQIREREEKLEKQAGARTCLVH